MFNCLVCALVFTVFCVLPGHATGPTAQFLEKHPLEAIVATIKAQGEEGFDTEKVFPFFLSVIEQENERCFGYHATTSAHMVFQAIVRCTLEELYGYSFPDNFYFLRAPDPQGPSLHSVAEYFEQFSRKELSFKNKSRFVEFFFVRPLARQLDADYARFDVQEGGQENIINQVYKALLHFAPVAPDFEISQEEVHLLLKEFAERIVLAPASCVQNAVDEWIKDPHRDWEEDLHSDWDENLDDESHEFINGILYPFNDTEDTQQALLSALNISLFGNYFLSAESTVHIFAKDSSVSLPKSEIRARARHFLKLIGLKGSLADDIYSYAEERLKLKGGVLLQFFDKGTSDNPLVHLNDAAFVCTYFGVPNLTVSPSALVSDFSLYKCEEGDAPLFGHIVIHPQLRLSATPQAVLNPFSWLEIRQYDLMSHKAKVRLKMYIREKLRRAKKDAAKNLRYRNYLESIWARQGRK